MKTLYGLLILLVLISGCARYTPPPYTPVEQRPQANSDAPWPAGKVVALGYHDVADREPDNNFMAVRTAT